MLYPELKSLKLASLSPPSISGSHILWFFSSKEFHSAKPKTYSISEVLKENKVAVPVSLILKSTLPTPQQEERQRHAAS